jgi:hypothetical protein
MENEAFHNLTEMELKFSDQRQLTLRKTLNHQAPPFSTFGSNKNFSWKSFEKSDKTF